MKLARKTMVSCAVMCCRLDVHQIDPAPHMGRCAHAPPCPAAS
jgi:hypothetical protein